MIWSLFIGLLIFFELIADIFSKKWSLTGDAHFWLLAIVGYVVANIFWLSAIRLGSGLARGGLIFSIGSAIGVLVLGLLVYKEAVSKVQLVGMIVGIISLCLILWE